jgi:imidazolonepropionase-like amidohydrolase
MWTGDTVEAIFPGRRIGRLKPDYEASFLVLSGNPLVDFFNVTGITRRVKKGHPVG